MTEHDFDSMRGDARKAITDIEPELYTKQHLDPPSTKEQRRQHNQAIYVGPIPGGYIDKGLVRGTLNGKKNRG